LSIDDDGHDDDLEPTPVAIARFDLVEHLLEIGQVKRARELAAEAIAADPDDARNYAAMSRVLLDVGEREGAIEAAAQAIRLEPEWPSAWRVHGLASFFAGKFADAERSLLEAIRLEPDDGSVFQLYARLLAVCGRPVEALDFARRALELDPDDETAHHLFASLLHEVRPSQWKISEELATRAVSLNPGDADAFAVLGAIVFSRGRRDEAEGHFRSALEIDPNNRLAMEGLAQVVMAKNWLYRPFLSYQLLMMRLGMGAQLLVVASLWAVVSIITASVVTTEPASTLVTIGYLALCAYTWFATPLTRAILRRRYPWL
jgi:tetratricopeptide (TPR) repeat protein